jgi:hypothetical protein
MPLSDIIEKSKKFEIQSYKKKFNPKEMRKTHVPFTGSPQKHPYDSDKVILLTEPYSSSSYYEFKKEDIAHVEELPHITNMDEETVTMVRIWIKNKSIGIHCTPFSVEDVKIKF